MSTHPIDTSHNIGICRAFISAEMKSLIFFLVLLFALHCALGAHNLNEEYRFSAELDPSYKLHWMFDLEAGTIAFAVNVSTTGWVGFGLSPNGQMPGSDVVIGWVQNNGQVEFQDRYAIGRFLPPVDPSQDWFLVSGEEENGYTILEFRRDLITCDTQNDLNVEANTARIVWSYHSSDPTGASSIPIHEAQGSASLNLLGGLLEERVEPDSSYFDIRTGNVTIPAVDTTYWCAVGEIPTEIQEQERYVFQISQVITEGNFPFVHHILVYLCTDLDETHLGASGLCDDIHVDIEIGCRRGSVFAAAAIGGTDFTFPPGVGIPVGGPGARRYFLIEMHYDNPELHSGGLDDSGLRFSYGNTRPEHIAQPLNLFHTISPELIVPPGVVDFTISAFCSSECTQTHFPPEGVKVFGSWLHTHLAGHGLAVDHIRETECGLKEELMPIDLNRQYDFDYQQTVNLQREVTVLPGDELRLHCFYGTPNYTNVTLGGDSTREEMCMTALYYYPQTTLTACLTAPELTSFQEFTQQFLNPSMHEMFMTGIRTRDNSLTSSALNTIEWTPEAINSLQQVFMGGSYSSFCNGAPSTGFTPIFSTGLDLPTADCPYVPADTCTGELGSQGRCCEGSGAAKPSHLSALLSVIAVALSLVVML